MPESDLKIAIVAVFRHLWGCIYAKEVRSGRIPTVTVKPPSFFDGGSGGSR